MDINEKINRLLDGTAGPQELMELMASVATDSAMEEKVINCRRALYTEEQIEDYGSFIPAGSVAADDGQNLCDFQCEKHILELEGVDVPADALASVAKKNYWLRSQGTPLFNMGKLMERNGLLINRTFNASLEDLKSALDGHRVIVVVNGDTLLEKEIDILSESFDVEDNPNHAVVVESLSIEDGKVTLFNPATDENATSEYPLEVFMSAWEESRNYMVTARAKKAPYEYNPQPLDVSSVNINPELMELIDLIAENAHDIWAMDKFKAGFRYAPADKDGKEKDGNFNHYLLPYEMLSEEDKEPDRKMALQTIRLVKRLGYRLVNINSMYRCPSCGEVIEPDHNFCCNCGRELSWKDFR